MNDLSSLLNGSRFHGFSEIVGDSRPLRNVSGLWGSSLAALTAYLSRHGRTPILLVTKTQKEAEIAVEDIGEWLSGSAENPVRYFPPLSLEPYEWRIPFGQIVEQRLGSLHHFMEGKPGILVTCLSAFLQKLAHPSFMRRESVVLSSGAELDLKDLSQTLVHMGFTQENMVEDMGQFSVRGGIVDIYPYVLDNPIRIEMLGDTVESIREFDIFTQRSIQSREEVTVLPVEEYCLNTREIESGLLKLEDRFDAHLIEAEISRLLEEEQRVGRTWQIPLFLETRYSLLDYFPQKPLVIIDKKEEMASAVKEYHVRWEEGYRGACEKSLVVADPGELIFSSEEIDKRLGDQSAIWIYPTPVEGPGFHRLEVSDQVNGGGNLNSFQSVFDELHREDVAIYLLSPNKGQAERLKNLVMDFPVADVLVGNLSKGFVSHSDKIAVFTDHQIFNRFSRHLFPKKHRGGVAIPNFEALNRLDLVVHQDYGIGRYLGIKRIKIENHFVDCILIQYRDKSKLTLPVSDLKKLQKYSGKEDTSPPLSKLGGKSWEQLKRRTKKSILKLAHDLIELYAKRSSIKGFAFSADSGLQREFDEAFVYTPTPDQLTAVGAIKKDMETPVPMDRLICGDVGFGKTEVAMRGVFKSVLDKKQVAVLAPTTVLVSQHFASFQERFSNWPVRIEYLNRFRTRVEEKEILTALRDGKVDVLIGTHRIISNDVLFKDLGLIVVDEEQKFGVAQKEKLKKARMEVDVISMSATPIPRSLHMSLVGARDFSLIQTPPRNRIPIQTKVIAYQPEVIKEAMERELERGGQCFFVHNRVQNILEMTLEVEKLLPAARVGTAHGQMREKDLEQIMYAFINREYDILVCTAIIESGIDIPNVNTIVINNAHQFGLSQLFQIRGRVGRSATQAHCLLVAPPEPKFTDEAKKRLYALEKFTELGSGYKLAMRDLEIRGAGNILGVAQSGHITAVGFDTYCRLLKEAVNELQGKKEEPELNPEIDFSENAFLPEEYVEDGLQRISLYQKISRCAEQKEIDEVEGELRDRYGPLPAPATGLLQVVRAQLFARLIGLEKVSLRKRLLELRYSKIFEPGPQDLAPVIARMKWPHQFINQTPLKIAIHLNAKENTTQIDQAVEQLAHLAVGDPQNN